MKQFKQSQKIRVIISGVGFFTTVKQIREGMFCFINQSTAVQLAFSELESLRKNQEATCGLSGSWGGIQVQLSVM